ncbi:MAG: NAD(P)H-hydrate epimerase [Candidatus Margulisiibacteriota bacterium]|jgi:NAD(P)H-hydrate epimerase
MNFPCFSAFELQQLEEKLARDYQIDTIQLMELAGFAVADWLRYLLKSRLRQEKILILCGKGNNSGDGLVAARHLANFGFDVSVLLTCNPTELKPDPFKQYQILTHFSVPILKLANLEECQKELSKHTVYIDALYGFGLNKPITGLIQDLIQMLNKSGKPIYAIDCPSGLDCTTGQPNGPCIMANATLTLAALKVGFKQKVARNYLGELYLADIGVPPLLYQELGFKDISNFEKLIIKI